MSEAEDVSETAPAGGPDVRPEVVAGELDVDLARVHATFLEPLWQLPREKRANALAQRFLLGYTGHTRRAYGRDLEEWFSWCTVLAIDPLDANRAAVDGYRRQMENREPPAKPSTIARRLAALAGYYKYATAEGVLDRSPLEHVKRPSTPTDSPTLGLDRAEAKALLEAAREHSARSQALVTLLLHDGLRINEALSADVDDLSSARGHRTLSITRKGGARRDVVLAPSTAEAIATYLDDREDGPIFTTQTGRRWTQPGAYTTIQMLARRAGIEHADKLSPHSLRHTFVTLAREAGVPLEDVQDAAGHADPRTTRRYDRGRHNLDRHPAYTLAAFLAD
ncbi:tyrosine-type recombinase/integrase [Nocardioides sp. NPDC051685]|uniref:tyrosine-type recombinase/integrase n=1 Tax=Nocardioides sp. NPDC051685 TaxID=3364334 RepID=UPI0037A0BE18